MKNRTAPPGGGFRGGLGRLLVVAVAAIGVGCASGGGGQAAMTRAEIDSLLAEYAGSWVLDESASSPQTIPRSETRTVGRVVRADELDDLRREAEEGQRLMAIRQATLELLRRRPESLALGVQGEYLVAVATPGESITLPLNGGWVSQTGGTHPIRTRAFWDGPRLGMEQMVSSEGRVSVVLEVVEGRLEMTRTIRFVGERVAPIVLMYDREGGTFIHDIAELPRLLLTSFQWANHGGVRWREGSGG